MSIGEWDIFGELARLRRDLNRFSRLPWTSPAAEEPEVVWTPAVDIFEQDGALVLLIDLPGVAKETIDLSVDADSLTLEGERAAATVGTVLRAERPSGRFRRSFRIGVPVNPRGVQAAYHDGVLQVTIPRALPSQPEKVKIKVE